MKIEEINTKGLEKKIRITIPAADMKSKFQIKVSEISKTARVNGYRPGNVPSNVIVARYGDAIYDELIQDILKEFAETKLKEFNIFGQPSLEDLAKEKEKDLTFTLKLELMPEIKLPDFSQIKIKQPKFEIKEEEIEKEIKDLSNKVKDFKPKKKAATKEDRLLLDVSIKDKALFNVFYFPAAGNFTLASELKSDEAKHLYTHIMEDNKAGVKLQKDVVGKDLNDVLDLQVACKHDNSKIQCQVKIKGIDEAIPVELNDDFAKRFGYKTLDDFRQYVTKLKSETANEQLYTIMSMRLFNQLEDLLNFEVPESLFKNEFDNIFGRIKQIRGEDDFWKDKSEKDVKDYAEKFALRRARIGMALNEYAKIEGIKVESQDIQEALMREIKSLPVQEQQVALDWYYKNPDNLKYFSGSALERKVVSEIVKNKLQIIDQKCSFADLNKIIDQETESIYHVPKPKTSKKAHQP